MSSFSHVSGPPRRGAAQALIVALKLLSTRDVYGPLRSVLRKLREQINSPGNSTMRGSGDHHSIGCCAAYQGNTPRPYAASSRAGLKSPPAASRPGGSRSACSNGGNQSGSVCSPNQMSLLKG